MNPTPQQIAAIRGFVANRPNKWQDSTDAILAAMRVMQSPNPVAAAPTIRKSFTYDDLAAALDATSKPALAELAATIARFLEDVDAQDLARLQRWGRILVQRGKLTAAQATALNGIINATQADPAWSPQIPWDVANLGRPADGFDIEAARQ